MDYKNSRDLLRGLLIGLIAGTGWVIAYLIVILFTQETAWAKPMTHLAWLVTIPVPAFLFNHFQKYMKKDEPVTPVEPVAEEDEKDEEEPHPKTPDHAD